MTTEALIAIAAHANWMLVLELHATLRTIRGLPERARPCV